MYTKCLVIVRGGCAEVYAEKDVDAVVVDFDNEPDAVCPEGFEGLWKDNVE